MAAAERDFYEVLGVPRDAKPAQIQRAYRKLARDFHPDMNKDPGAADRFKEVAQAYQVLSDPEQRKRYDAFGHDFRRVPEDVEVAGARRSRPGARSTRRAHAPPGASGDVDLSNLFDELFGNRFGAVPGADQEAEVTLMVEEAFRGTRRRITLSDGRSIEVNIPPGVREGQRIRLAGQGGQGFGDGRAGDLYLRVHLAPDPRFRLDGRDLHVDLPVAPWEAALGASVVIDGMEGEEKVDVPAGSSTGRWIRLPGKGLRSSDGKRGDLIAEVRVVVPERLSAKERALFEELARVSKFDPRRRR